MVILSHSVVIIEHVEPVYWKHGQIWPLNSHFALIRMIFERWAFLATGVGFSIDLFPTSNIFDRSFNWKCLYIWALKGIIWNNTCNHVHILLHSVYHHQILIHLCAIQPSTHPHINCVFTLVSIPAISPKTFANDLYPFMPWIALSFE